MDGKIKHYVLIYPTFPLFMSVTHDPMIPKWLIPNLNVIIYCSQINVLYVTFFAGAIHPIAFYNDKCVFPAHQFAWSCRSKWNYVKATKENSNFKRINPPTAGYLIFFHQLKRLIFLFFSFWLKSTEWYFSRILCQECTYRCTLQLRMIRKLPDMTKNV